MNKQQQIEWHEEYYPEEADNFQPKYNRTWLEAAEHSLKKWEGIAAIVESDVKLKNTTLIGGTTCALCQRSTGFWIDCDICPIQASGMKPCPEHGSAYQQTLEKGDPEIMTECLEDVITFIEESDFDAKAN